MRSSATGRSAGADGVTEVTRSRCAWAGADPLYCDYHDQEWGVPERDSRALWETLVLDGFQAGLSWITILRKREAFRKAFANFDPDAVANYGPGDVQRLMDDAGIIRSCAKIEAAIASARLYVNMRDTGEGFAGFVWSFVGGEPVQNAWASQTPAQTPLSQDLSKALKGRGFGFAGPVIVYAWMQATGMVNDHVTTCFRHSEVARAGR